MKSMKSTLLFSCSFFLDFFFRRQHPIFSRAEHWSRFQPFVSLNERWLSEGAKSTEMRGEVKAKLCPVQSAALDGSRASSTQGKARHAHARRPGQRSR